MSVTAGLDLHLDDSFARELVGLHQPWAPVPVTEPAPIVLNDALAAELGLDVAALRSPDGVALLAGNTVPEGVETVAQAYAGHQFGGYSPRLGDGRALLLGEFVDADGHRRDLHLKGSGRTPFARGGDGRAAVGPMLREYLMGEAMHALGIPTTRALAVVATGESIIREVDGRGVQVPGAVLARIASSHLRVGTFQYASASGDRDLLQRLTDYAIARHAPDAAGADHPALALYEQVVAVQADLVAQWMAVGFIHGVMNTDNTTISGETIDYGPCAFVDAYDPATVYSSIDHGGRYAYGNQPAIMTWNLARLAEAMLPLFDDDGDRAIEMATGVLETFPTRFQDAWSRAMHAKLGLDVDLDVDVGRCDR
jgi:serine/tyrosine/threonine adenylyltransferase